MPWRAASRHSELHSSTPVLDGRFRVVLSQTTVGTKRHKRWPSWRPHCCCDSVRWPTQAAEYRPQVWRPFMKAAVTNRLAV
jgi:hypothetical protein